MEIVSTTTSSLPDMTSNHKGWQKGIVYADPRTGVKVLRKERYQQVLSEQDIISAPLASMATRSELDRLVGAGSFHSLANVASKAMDAYHKTKPEAAPSMEGGRRHHAAAAVEGGRKSLNARLM